MPDHYQRILYQYSLLKGDSTELFKEIIAVSQEIGLDASLTLLEKCCFEKRAAWIKTNFKGPTPGNADAVLTGFKWFYENYLHTCIPQDGELVFVSPQKIISRWWNPCPTLEACRKLGLDTRIICQKAYHRPVDMFLKQIHPQLRFERNYDCIRPYTGYCEEIILLDEEREHAV